MSDTDASGDDSPITSPPLTLVRPDPILAPSLRTYTTTKTRPSMTDLLTRLRAQKRLR